jgi:hypothetical protein
MAFGPYDRVKIGGLMVPRISAAEKCFAAIFVPFDGVACYTDGKK